MVFDLREVKTSEPYMHGMKTRLFDSRYIETALDLSSGHSFPCGESRYQMALKFFYKQMDLHTEPNIVDVGACSGGFILLAALHPGASVVAFEPLTSAWNMLNESIILNNLQVRTHVFRVALWTNRGVRGMRIPVDSKLTYRATFGKARELHWSEPSTTALVATRSMDEMMHPVDQVDLMKIHVNGAELQVLQGGEQTIKNWKPDMLIRFSERNCSQLLYNREDIVQLLDGWGAITEHVLQDWLWITWK